ncbi:5-oxoprolinase subunit PxpA [Candidatus Aciduliprofundum boonei]|uniref:LamB/YcsF family protein n=1 Tax=Aciduliprofundum boonei (strain DSM 19572 / T469) TaxID=439481 RepID=B5ICJ8_ACIB4|nr:5-oxoprolinase subunit PxpA [Candidatus Aciduliprofundum boonei]ADD09077.1 LamB/YcsF family protein [Aciduliprofundum boonei T469]EDY36064.1 LamB/YcsF family [Aciduliprofundum boonei T469]HII55265.1 LamB/YcsF family protein [Candidatus Aciduliprofundum boonei]
MKVDLNADLGESFSIYKIGNDTEIMNYITSANIACGWHGGDPIVMRETVKWAKEKNVAIGAHPSYPDRLGFGRRYMKISSDEAKNYVIYQIGALYGFVKAESLKIQHVKPHGALYNAMVRDEDLARGIIEGILEFDKELIFVGPSNSKIMDIAEDMGLRVAHEVFADRAYNSDGTLVPRGRPRAVIEDKEEIARRVISIVKDGGVKAIDGKWVELRADTICIHGDNPNAVEIVKYLRRVLDKECIDVVSMGEFIK